jgi:hypothetical protein
MADVGEVGGGFFRLSEFLAQRMSFLTPSAWLGATFTGSV